MLYKNLRPTLYTELCTVIKPRPLYNQAYLPYLLYKHPMLTGSKDIFFTPVACERRIEHNAYVVTDMQSQAL